MRRAMLTKVKDGVFRLDSFVRQVALSVFGNNPFDDLKVHFCCLQLQKLLHGSPDNPSLSHLYQRQMVLMMLQMYPIDQPSKCLNLTTDNVSYLLSPYSESDVAIIIDRLAQKGIFSDPREYFSFCHVVFPSPLQNDKDKRFVGKSSIRGQVRR